MEAELKVPVHGPRENFTFPPEKDGIAQYNYPNTLFTYIGEWKNGRKMGKGKFFIGKNSYYEGDFLDGEITGNGIRIFSNGSKYEGQFLNGEFNGRGIYINNTNGEVYEGEWKDNRRCGEGKLTYSDGTVYVGSFLNHKRHGFGRYTDSQNNKYEGEWFENSITGRGTMEYGNGDWYSGEFLNGKKHGRGKVIWALKKNLSFNGEWKNDNCLYSPQDITILDLPFLTPGSCLEDVTVKINGGEGESGRPLKIMIEIGRIDPNLSTKKAAKHKKSDIINLEPKFMVLNSETQETSLLITTESGLGVVPPIQVPADTEQNTYTLIVTDESEENPLPQAMADFTFTLLATSESDKQSAKGKAPQKKSIPKVPKAKK